MIDGRSRVPVEKRTALQKAVSQFEPLEQVLSSMQADRISEELATNITSSLTILQDKARARRLSQHLLSRHPNLEQLLRIHVRDLAENDKIDDLRALTDGNPSNIAAITFSLDQLQAVPDSTRRHEPPHHQNL